MFHLASAPNVLVALLDDTGFAHLGCFGSAIDTPNFDRLAARHWDQGEAVRAPLPGAKPEFFFAPGQRAKREQDWGPAELNSRIDRAYRSLVEHSRSWLNVEYRYGSTGIEATYTELLNGTADPSAGFICIPSAEASSG